MLKTLNDIERKKRRLLFSGSIYGLSDGFGAGTDGDLDVSGNLNYSDAAGSVIFKEYDTVNISSGANITFTNKIKGYVLLCRTSFTMSAGTINLDGKGYNGGSSSDGVITWPVSGLTWTGYDIMPDNPSLMTFDIECGAGGAGGDGGGACLGGTSGKAGGAGGSAGQFAGGPGGGGGVGCWQKEIYWGSSSYVDGVAGGAASISDAGAGGVGANGVGSPHASPDAGDGGDAGGAIIIVISPKITISSSAIITAKGLAGGNGVNGWTNLEDGGAYYKAGASGSGGGGGGGAIVLCYRDLATIDTSACSVSGGAAGTGGSVGSAGSPGQIKTQIVNV